MKVDLFRGSTGRLRLGWRLLVFGILFTALVAVAMALVPGDGLVVQGAVVLVAALGTGWSLLYFVEGRKPEALGFYLTPRALRETGAGLLVGSGLAWASVGSIYVAGGVRWEMEGGDPLSFLGGALGALAFFALPAAGEEALARGYPLQALAETWGSGPALVVTSVGFGLLHLANPGLSLLAMVNLMAAGLLLGVIYLRTGSLWWASGAHLGWNWAHGYVADLPVSGLELVDAPLWDGVSQGPVWLGGGSFGPEGSIVTTGVVLAGAAALWWGPWLRPSRAARSARPLVPLRPEREAGAPSPEAEGRRNGDRRSTMTRKEGSG